MSDYGLWISFAGLIVTALGWAVTYGKLQGRVSAVEKAMSGMKEDTNSRIAERSKLQDERDRRQDHRTKALEDQIRAHTGDLSELKVLVTGIATDLKHVVKAVDRIKLD